MAAYNWIAMEVRCPGCGHDVTLRCQTHVASSYDGDLTGKFFDREYRMGQRMAWWPAWHEDADDWHADGGRGDDDEEECVGECPHCRGRLSVTLRFRDRRPVELIKIAVGSPSTEAQ